MLMEKIIYILALIGKYFAVILFIGTLYSAFAYKHRFLEKLIMMLIMFGAMFLFIVCKHYTQ